jgi:hypothetical protein
MANLRRLIIVASALSSTAWSPHALAQTGLRDRLAAATEAVERSCGEDIRNSAARSRVARGEFSCACRLITIS